MDLITPGIGLTFWMLVSFSTVFFILAKYAWPLILNGLKDRERYIQDSLLAADKAQAEMAKLKSENQEILEEAKVERQRIIHQGKEIKEQIIKEAKTQAQIEIDALFAKAKAAIDKEKEQAIEEMKNQIVVLSVDIAEKIMKETLSTDKKQIEFAQKLVEGIKLN